jgi:hypothetical protein
VVWRRKNLIAVMSLRFLSLRSRKFADCSFESVMCSGRSGLHQYVMKERRKEETDPWKSGNNEVGVGVPSARYVHRNIHDIPGIFQFQSFVAFILSFAIRCVFRIAKTAMCACPLFRS